MKEAKEKGDNTKMANDTHTKQAKGVVTDIETHEPKANETKEQRNDDQNNRKLTKSLGMKNKTRKENGI